MTLVEFIGFAVSLAAMFFLTARNFRQQRQRKKLAAKESRPVKSGYIKQGNRQVPFRKPPQVPHPLEMREKDPYRDEQLLSEKFRQKETKSAAYELSRESHVSRASLLIGQLPSPRQMLIFKEIFGPPKAVQNPWNER